MRKLLLTVITAAVMLAGAALPAAAGGAPTCPGGLATNDHDPLGCFPIGPGEGGANDFGRGGGPGTI